MQGLIDSFRPILERYKVEVLLLNLALFITILSSFFYLRDEKSENYISEREIMSSKKNYSQADNLTVDVSGAVENPDIYEVSSGARLKHILVEAGGLSAEADREFFAKNFNLAQIMHDQDKIYIPTKNDVLNSDLPALNQVQTNLESPVSLNSKIININTASQPELETLHGIGRNYASRIIEKRPYTSIQDLVEKKIVPKNLYDSIRGSITI